MQSDPASDLRRVVQRLFRNFGALGGSTTPCGQPLSMAHAHALMVLRPRKALTQQSLAAELCIDKSNVTRLCAKMVAAGHVSQQVSEKDRRSRMVSLTANGRRVAQDVDASSLERFRALLAALPKRHAAPLIDSLNLLVDAIVESSGAHRGSAAE